MIKGKRGVALAMSLIAISLTACGEDYTYPDANWKDGQIVTIGNKSYSYDDVYKYFEGSKSSAQSYFNVAKSVLAQTVTTRNDAIESIIDTKIEKLHDTWKTSARTNNTSYKEEQEKTFDSEGVENEAELREKYLAQEQVDENKQAFESTKTEDDGYQFAISEDTTKDYVKDYAPYHVSHILIKVDASSTGEGYYNGQISSDDAKQINNVVRMLSSGTSFGSVAQIASDDGSNTQYGELYTQESMAAMQKDTSYVNEFKLGVYAYDTFLNPKTKDNNSDGDNASNKTIRESLRVPGKADGSVSTSKVADNISDTLVGQGEAFGIPLSAAFTMNSVADMEKNPVTGASITTDHNKTVSARQFPRNILFNNYFNYRGVSFIYDDSDEYDDKFLAEVNQILEFQGNAKRFATIDEFKSGAEDVNLSYKLDEYNYVKAQLENINKDRFQDFSGKLAGYAFDRSSKMTDLSDNLLNKKVLVDEKKNAIIIARAGTSGDSGYQGIHFIVVNNDPFVADNNGGVENKYKYYRVNVPVTNSSDANYSKEAYSASYSEHPSFINFVNPDANSTTTFNNRRATVEKVIKTSLKNEDISLWKYNLAQFKTKYGFDFTDKLSADVKAQIEQYITLTESASKDSSDDSLDSSWETYIKEINIQTNLATDRMVPVLGVAAFESGNLTSEMEEICYVD